MCVRIISLRYGIMGIPEALFCGLFEIKIYTANSTNIKVWCELQFLAL